MFIYKEIMGADYYEYVCFDVEYIFKNNLIQDSFDFEKNTGFYYGIDSYPGNSYDDKVKTFLNIQTTKQINIDSCDPYIILFVSNRIKEKHNFEYQNPNYVLIKSDIQDSDILSYVKINKIIGNMFDYADSSTVKNRIESNINFLNKKNLAELNFKSDIQIQKIIQRTYRCKRS